eukprot:scaffold340634_cov14-Prasinocladus_malaysianus.AAC.1
MLHTKSDSLISTHFTPQTMPIEWRRARAPTCLIQISLNSGPSRPCRRLEKVLWPAASQTKYIAPDAGKLGTTRFALHLATRVEREAFITSA